MPVGKDTPRQRYRDHARTEVFGRQGVLLTELITKGYESLPIAVRENAPDADPGPVLADAMGLPPGPKD